MLMRALIVLLLVLNLGVAVWWLARSEPAAPQPREPQGIPRLQLVREAAAPAASAPPPGDSAAVEQASPPQVDGEPSAEAEAAAALASEAQAPPEPALPNLCFSLGPFQTNADAMRAGSALANRVVASNVRQVGPASGNWDVVVPPQADRAAADALAARLVAAGFTDNYVVGSGEGANGIALGRFGNQASAQRHVAALQAAGFPAQLRPPQNAQRAWLDVEVAPGANQATLRASAGAAQVEARACAGA